MIIETYMYYINKRSARREGKNELHVGGLRTKLKSLDFDKLVKCNDMTCITETKLKP